MAGAPVLLEGRELGRGPGLAADDLGALEGLGILQANRHALVHLAFSLLAVPLF